MEKFTKQIEDLNIPYPQKHDLLRELASDLEHMGSLEEAGFSSEDLKSLAELHRTQAFKIYSLQRPALRKLFDLVFVYSPLLLMSWLIIKENRMFAFMMDGGLPGMIVILCLGALLLGQQLFQAFQLGILKDHRIEKRNVDSLSLLIGVGALMTLGLAWTVFDVYVTADSVVRAKLSNELLLEGLKESLAPFVLSLFLGTLILFTHYGSRRLLVLWKIPAAN